MINRQQCQAPTLTCRLQTSFAAVCGTAGHSCTTVSPLTYACGSMSWQWPT